jgi:hypothetical protein
MKNTSAIPYLEMPRSRPRDVAKQREPVRTVDQLERQFRGGFRVFVQVNGLRCIDLGDRRSGVEISPARPMNPQVVAGPKMSSTTFAPAAA